MKNVFPPFIILIFIFSTSCNKEDSSPEPTPVVATTPTPTGPTSSDTVQDLLDNGSTPIEIFNQGYTLSEIYCKTYSGGYIFYLDTISGKGLVCSTSDFMNGVTWDPTGTPTQDFTYVYLGVTDTAIWSGQQNTTSIALLRPTSPFASVEALTLAGYNDWFIASKNESILMFNVLGVDGCNLLSTGLNEVYWTSSELNNIAAYRMINYSGVGDGSAYQKHSEYSIRPIRKF
ncbi:hypothetical protein FRY74_03445 [Vicingus serpentipes]|uniref:DUF1566 domain-containing protein n=1 Tax=Vicingus serpentipes TaxID=1926625 RepID=A0A5C6RYL9_9FLAO|nr:hypothetical protein [Vicingus serpentipes]TXB67253.1 hypothetical protein FRY74_03445 [Vicingus serpentipes]